MPLIPVLRMQRQVGHCEFEAILVYRVSERPCIKRQNHECPVTTMINTLEPMLMTVIVVASQRPVESGPIGDVTYSPVSHLHHRQVPSNRSQREHLLPSLCSFSYTDLKWKALNLEHVGGSIHMGSAPLRVAQPPLLCSYPPPVSSPLGTLVHCWDPDHLLPPL